jgi:SAM-dependent methyltransferase
MYDQFSRDYDRFVNWDARLGVEMPFLVGQLSGLSEKDGRPVRVLDAACGTGQHIIALTEAGFRGAGADLSAGMTSLARANAADRGLDIPFRTAAFHELTAAFGKAAFDVLLCLGNSLPHVLTRKGLLAALRDFRAVLRPGGKLILQNRNFDRVLAEHQRWMAPQTYRKGRDTWVFHRFYDFDPDGRLTFNIVRLYSHDEAGFDQRVTSTRLWPLTRVELDPLLKKAGFVDIIHFGDMTGGVFDPEESPNLIITARTP